MKITRIYNYHVENDPEFEFPDFDLDLEFEVHKGVPAKTQADPDECYPEEPAVAYINIKKFKKDFEYCFEGYIEQLKKALKKEFETKINDIEENPEEYFEDLDE